MVFIFVMFGVGSVIAILFSNALAEGRRQQGVSLNSLLEDLRLDPKNRGIHSNIVSLIRIGLSVKPADLAAAGISSEAVYKEALGLVATFPSDIGLRDFALQVGRWHYCRGRENNAPTVYDEQTIHNDLVVHMMSPAT